jgi:small subunit ribosomal protein S18
MAEKNIADNTNQNVEVTATIGAETSISVPTPAPTPAPAQSEQRRDDRRDDRGPSSDKKKFYYTKKVCKFCTKQVEEKAINYKNVDLLKRFVMPSGKILPRRISGNCAKHQRRVVVEVKNARILAILPIMDR